MAMFLRIRNPGVCPIEAFTTLGTSLSREVSQSHLSWIIGMFGSGSKHAVAMFLRYLDPNGTWRPISPTVFAGYHRLEWFTEHQVVNDGITRKDIHVIWIQHGGKDQATGKATRRKEKTSMSIDSGAMDWKDMGMAIREFVSNAFDMSFRQYCHEHLQKNPEATSAGHDLESLTRTLDPVPAWKRVEIGIVDEREVKATPDHTSVFLPIVPVIEDFFTNKHRWFLQFSEMKSIKATAVMPKASRNLPRKDRYSDTVELRKSAVVFRKGVRVREFGEDSDIAPKPSIFDYNLNSLRIDEARKADDDAIQTACATALIESDDSTIEYFFESLKECQPHIISPAEGNTIDGIVLGAFDPKYWELDFSPYALTRPILYSRNTTEKVEELKASWKRQFFKVFGENAVLTNDLVAGNVQSKGMFAVWAGENLISGFQQYDIPTYHDVLTDDDKAGRVVMDAPPAAVQIVGTYWRRLHGMGLIAEEVKMPMVKGYTMDAKATPQQVAKAQTMYGYYDKDSKTIFFSASRFAGSENKGLLARVALEQLALHITGLGSFEVEYYQWLSELAAGLLLKEDTAGTLPRKPAV